MTERSWTLTIIVFVLVIFGLVIGVNVYGRSQYSKGYSKGRDMTLRNVERKHEQVVNQKFRESYISGCVDATAESLALFGRQASEIELTVVCAEHADTKRANPWYNIN